MKKEELSSFRRIFISLISVAGIALFGMQTSGEHWTAAQKEVWACQEEYYELWRKGDFEGLLAMCLKDYTVWPYGSEGPVEGREHIDNIVTHAGISLFMLTPVQINVVGNTAGIYFIRKITLQEGRVYSDYAMSVWVKQDGKWLVMGEMNASYKPMSIYLPRMHQDQL